MPKKTKPKAKKKFSDSYFRSKEFKNSIMKQIKKDTWGKGRPMIYMRKNGEIVEHWKSGKIRIIKKAISGKSAKAKKLGINIKSLKIK